MTRTRWLSVLLLCVSCILMITTIITAEVAREECKQVIVPDYHTLLKQMHRYKYRNKSCRVSAMAIAEFKNRDIKSGLKMSDLSDYALHLIVTTNALKDDIRKINIANHKLFIPVVMDYDDSANQFLSEDVRANGIVILGENGLLLDTINNMTDKDIFELLTKQN